MSKKNDNFNDQYKKSTPPSKIKIRNPFDRALIERLHKPICSPGMCKIYKKKNKGSFKWEIDQTCTLVPADIVVCSSQFEPTPDPVLEKIAEEANEKFFSQEMVMPSPLETSKKVKPLLKSFDTSIQITSAETSSTKITKEVSVQTMLTLPPTLPPEIEKILEPFCNFTEEHNIFEDYEVMANGSLRRKLLFEEQSDIDHYDSEQTDDEINLEQRPPSSCEAHTPVVFSPDELSSDHVSRGIKRTFGTPLQKRLSSKLRNKILDVVDFGEPCFSPIDFQTPKRSHNSNTSSSLASASISPVTKATSSDEEKNNLTSPECEDMATCLDCFVSESNSEKKKRCFCKITTNKSLSRSTSLKESPCKSKRGSLLMEKRSLSMSSLHRSRSVQKLDFSMDMSIDGSLHASFQADSESSSIDKVTGTWSIEEDSSMHHLVKIESLKNKSDLQSSTKIHMINVLDETPIKGSKRNNIFTHEISKMRTTIAVSPEKMSLDNSLDNFDIPPNMEDRKIDFNKVDLKFLTENISQVEYSANYTKVTSNSSSSFKRVDSGFNENTFNANASSYYESAIKPSELTVTNVSKCETKTALREISNINWMRVDSGFKDETSADSMLFYPESSMKKVTNFDLIQNNFQDKENMEEYDKFLHAPSKEETMTMSDIFNDDLKFNCKFSSTPSKNKSGKKNS